MADSVIQIEEPARQVRSWLSGQALFFIACVPILIFLVGPILIIIPMAFTSGQMLMFPPQGISVRPFVDLFADAQWMASAVISLKTAAVSTLLATVVGGSAALALNRSKIRFKAGITAIILLPVMVPTVVLALGDYLFMLQLGLTGKWTSIALAHSVIVTPYVFVAVQASLAGLDPALSRAARSLGAGSMSLLRHVYWPAIRPGVLGGAIFAFIGSFDEIVISMFLAGPGVITLPVQIFNSLQTELTPKIAAVSVMLFMLSILGLCVQAIQSGSKITKNKNS